MHVRSELDHVEVGLEDPILGERALDVERVEQLAQLPHERALVARVEVLRELLRDRAAAAQRSALVRPRRECHVHLLDVVAVVRVEARVLGRDHGGTEPVCALERGPRFRR
jgi:hypothetical protein